MRNVDSLIFAGLTLVVAALAVAAKLAGLASALEAVSFVTGAICVWLTVKENVWNFPIGLANAATFSIVFYESHLFADAGLQVVYFVLTAMGWYMWLRGGEAKSALQISYASRGFLAAIAVAVALLTVLLWQTLRNFGGSASFWDALTTAISLGAQWLLNRKKVESWVLWIVVDIIYVPLYIYKGLYLTALLYAAFLAMAFMGFARWRSASQSANSIRPTGVTSI